MLSKINVDKLESWINSNFDIYKKYKNDFLVNSVFTEDKKFKLSISHEKQCYHCWKTDESGPLWKLVCHIQNCTKKEAFEEIYDTNSIDSFEYKINNLKECVNNKIKTTKNKQIDYPEGFEFISTNSTGEINNKALHYCSIQRKIDPIKWKLGYCYKGKYQKRLIIPFYDKNGKFIYFIARALYNQDIKYINPSVENEEIHTKKEEILFSRDWNFDNQDVIIVEGALDAMILIDLGFNAVSIQGKSISINQINMLRMSRNMVLGLDNDKPGRSAIQRNIDILDQEGVRNVKYVFPPINNSDWNQCYLTMGNSLRSFISNNIKEYDFKSNILNKLKKI